MAAELALSACRMQQYLTLPGVQSAGAHPTHHGPVFKRRPPVHAARFSSSACYDGPNSYQTSCTRSSLGHHTLATRGAPGYDPTLAVMGAGGISIRAPACYNAPLPRRQAKLPFLLTSAQYNLRYFHIQHYIICGSAQHCKNNRFHRRITVCRHLLIRCFRWRKMMRGSVWTYWIWWALRLRCRKRGRRF